MKSAADCTRGPQALLACIATLIVIVSLAPSSASAVPPTEEQCQRRAGLLAFFERLAEPGARPFIELVVERLKRKIADNCVRLNDIQVLGTHNSYHVQPKEPLFALFVAIEPAALAWEYTHAPIREQMAGQGVRQLELDVFADPEGGLYAVRLGPLLVRESPFGPPALWRPGMKVLHVQHLDFETRCISLVACLQEVKSWSDANPGHLPLTILVEPKDDPLVSELVEESRVPIPFGPKEFDDLDAEIRSVFPQERLITPDVVRGDYPTLEAAILADGWPSLGESRGKILFLLDNGGDVYRRGHPSLVGRVMFTDSTPGEDDAAFVKVNDPLADPARIPDLVETGYIVRTRADANTWEAREGDTTRRDAALASGAHFVSTDFPVPSPAPGFTDYFVKIPDGAPARCNPVRTTPGCRHDALEILADR